MNTSRQITIGLLSTVVLGLALSGQLAAQNPFGGADPFGGPAAPPAGGPAAGAPFAPQPVGGPPTPAETDPVVMALRESNPATPAERTRAMQAMLDHGRADEALRYLQSVLDMRLDRDRLAALERQFGAALFIRIAADPRLQPAGAEFSRAVLEAARQVATDAARLRALVDQLGDPAAENRRIALTELRLAGLDAANPLVQALADPARADQHGLIRAALVELGPAMSQPLMAALQAAQPDLRAQLIQVLGRLQAREALPLLVRPAVSEQDQPAASEQDQPAEAARQALRELVGAVPDRQQAITFLRGELTNLLDADTLPEPPPAKTVWTWDSQQGGLQRERVPGDRALMVRAARLAEELVRLEPAVLDHRRWYLATALEAAKRLDGYGRSVVDSPRIAALDRSLIQDPAVIEDVLHYAIEQRLVGAAIAAAELLGRYGDRSLVHTVGPDMSPLVSALRHPNRRLQFAAAQAIVALDPQAPYPGSSFLVETLGYLASTAGTRRALVVHPRADTSQSLVGLLAEIGFDAEAVPSGRQALLAATRQPDIEFVLVSPFIERPTYTELIQLLRRDGRTASLPVGILARPDQLEAARQFAQRDSATRAFPRPHSVESIGYVLQELLAWRPVDRVPQGERAAHAAAALESLLRFARQPEKYAFYELRRLEPQVEVAAASPALSAQAAELLGHLGTPAAQRALVDLASQNFAPLPVRQAAAEAFGRAVQEHYLLLTTPEILRQYDRYNQSANLDKDTQQVLGNLLDVIESRVPQATPQGAAPPGDGSTD